MNQDPLADPRFQKHQTMPTGPVIVSARVMQTFLAIRQDKLLPKMFDQLIMAQSNVEAVKTQLPDKPLPDWVSIVPDAPEVELPPRLNNALEIDRLTFQACIANGCSRVLIDGPVKEKAKLSFFKCEGVISILVSNYRAGRLKLVRPMVKAITALGYEDMLPPKDQLQMIYDALEHMGEPY